MMNSSAWRRERVTASHARPGVLSQRVTRLHQPPGFAQPVTAVADQRAETLLPPDHADGVLLQPLNHDRGGFQALAFRQSLADPAATVGCAVGVAKDLQSQALALTRQEEGIVLAMFLRP